MKTIITLKDIQESLDFIKNIDLQELKDNLEFVYPSKLDLTIKGNFYVSFTGSFLWIENDDTIFLRIPFEIVKDYIVK